MGTITNIDGEYKLKPAETGDTRVLRSGVYQ